MLVVLKMTIGYTGRQGGTMQGKALISTVLVVMLAAAGTVVAQEVTLPLDRYENLHARAHPQPTPTPKPAAGYSVDQVRLEIVAGRDSARVVQELHLYLLSNDWQEIPLAASGTVIAAELGGLEGRVNADRGWTLTVRGNGRHRVRLESLLPLVANEEATRPTWSLALELPRAAVVQGEIKVSQEVEEVELLAGGIWREHGRQGWLFAGEPGTTLRAQLLGKAIRPQRSSLPLRLSVVSGNLATISRTRIKLLTHLDLQIVQGSLDELTIALPEGFEVVSLAGDAIAGWNVAENRLLVTPLTTIESSLHLRIHLGAEASNQLDSPLLVPDGAWRVLAASAVKIEGDGLLELVDRGSGRLPDERELVQLPQRVTSASSYTMVVPDRGRPPCWEVTWPEAAEVLAAQVDRMLVDLMAGDNGTAAYQVWVTVRSTGATSITLGVPPGFRLLSAGRDATPLIPGIAAHGLALPLTASPSPQVVHLAGLITLQVPAGTGSLLLPTPSLSAPASRVEVRALLPGGRTYSLGNPALHGAVSSPPRVTTATGKSSKLALQTGFVTTGGYQADLFTTEADVVKIEASWSALSSTPDPVAVEVKARSEKEEWF
jgi:hypothetical protein